MTWVFLAGGTGAALRVALVPLLDDRLQAVLPTAGTFLHVALGLAGVELGLWLGRSLAPGQA